MYDKFFSMPPDPFADDPADPAATLDAVSPTEPLEPEERAAIEDDLADLVVYQALLKHRGIRGLIVHCDDCDEDHYHDWDMLNANLRQLLLEGNMHPHEPAYEPDPTDYVTWDYCRGYTDAIMHMADDDIEI